MKQNDIYRPAPFQYWSCPNDGNCGLPLLIQPLFNVTTLQTITPSASSNLVNGTICKHLIRLPAKGGPNDYINFQLTSLSRAFGYVSISRQYADSQENTNLWLNATNTSFVVPYGQQAFLTFFGNNVFRGDFQMKYQFVNNLGPNGDEIITSGSSSDESSSSDLGLLLIAIIVPCAVVILALTIGCALYFHCKKRKLRKVQNLKKADTLKDEQPRPASGINYANENEIEKLDMKTFQQLLNMKAQNEFGLDMTTYGGTYSNGFPKSNDFSIDNQNRATPNITSAQTQSSIMKLKNQSPDRALLDPTFNYGNQSLIKQSTRAPEDFTRNPQNLASDQNTSNMNINNNINYGYQPHSSQQKKPTILPPSIISMQEINQQSMNNQQNLPPINLRGAGLPPIAMSRQVGQPTYQ
eukprot:403349789